MLDWANDATERGWVVFGKQNGNSNNKNQKRSLPLTPSTPQKQQQQQQQKHVITFRQ